MNTPTNATMARWLGGRARRNPDNIALIADGERISYQALWTRAARLAAHLAGRGVRTGDRVAVLGATEPLGLEVLAACGVLGAIAVPLHPGFSPRALESALELSQAAVVVASPSLADRLPPAASRLSVLTDPTPWREAHGSPPPIASPPVGLDACALIAFSSGTTGLSKGVALSHGNLLWNAVNLLTCMDIRPDDIMLGSAPLYRMGGLGFALAMLLKGGTIVLQRAASADESLALVESHRINIVFDSPTALEAMTRSPAFEARDLSSLRVCATGGTAVPASLVDAFGRQGLRLQTGYGLTEAAPLGLLLDADQVAAHPGSAGRPPVFGAARVVDDQLSDVPAGAIGELVLEGPNVMLGYWRAAAASRAALVDGWLRTGDAASMSDDGHISIWGRLSDALELDGRRLHPGIAERAARAIDGVDDIAIVQARPQAEPIAFVEGAIDEAATAAIADVLERHLGVTVPVAHTRLPRNPNGKVMRDRLANPPRPRSDGQRLKSVSFTQ